MVKAFPGEMMFTEILKKGRAVDGPGDALPARDALISP